MMTMNGSTLTALPLFFLIATIIKETNKRHILCEKIEFCEWNLGTEQDTLIHSTEQNLIVNSKKKKRGGGE